jgi:hypothetical protein
MERDDGAGGVELVVRGVGAAAAEEEEEKEEA